MSLNSIPIVDKNFLFRPWCGVFETLKVHKGRVFFLEEHWQSLLKAASALEIKATEDFRLAAHLLPKKTGRWRWIVNTEKSYHFFQEEKTPQPTSFTLTVASQRVGKKNWDARYKTLSYLTHFQAREKTRTQEALLLNENEEIASASMANIFWVKNRQIKTPSLNAGCREGIVRNWILKNERVSQVSASPKALDEADEIFLTNSIIGICPVVRWRSIKKPKGKRTQALQSLYAREVF